MRVIYVSQKEIPTTAIALMGEQARNCWFFLSSNAAKRQAEVAKKFDCDESHCFLYCEEKEGLPEVTLDLVSISEDWKFCKKIVSKVIAYSTPVEKPEEIYFIKMEGEE